ncbi:MAG: 50S ribosomal protein L23 [Candidatus Nomurabacteria bacterium]|nr:50S ribosomal protein L23 [Candidatus Nomurabacteria bacterium]USN87462.1 MAG: 50S ribosomal protein L23 [Candidatus Nomurabacteria bacterium]
MALFSRKEEKNEEQAKTAVVAKAKAKALPVDYNLSDVIKGLRITEKAVKQGDQNVYTFNVNRAATKFQVRDAVKALYNVTPVKVNIVNKKPAARLSGSKNKMVKVPGSKKAYVYLKKGDTINLV